MGYFGILWEIYSSNVSPTFYTILGMSEDGVYPEMAILIGNVITV
jgi:hypothetical protein